MSSDDKIEAVENHMQGQLNVTNLAPQAGIDMSDWPLHERARFLRAYEAEEPGSLDDDLLHWCRERLEEKP